MSEQEAAAHLERLRIVASNAERHCSKDAYVKTILAFERSRARDVLSVGDATGYLRAHGEFARMSAHAVGIHQISAALTPIAVPSQGARPRDERRREEEERQEMMRQSLVRLSTESRGFIVADAQRREEAATVLAAYQRAQLLLRQLQENHVRHAVAALLSQPRLAAQNPSKRRSRRSCAVERRSSARDPGRR